MLAVSLVPPFGFRGEDLPAVPSEEKSSMPPAEPTIAAVCLSGTLLAICLVAWRWAT